MPEPVPPIGTTSGQQSEFPREAGESPLKEAGGAPLPTIDLPIKSHSTPDVAVQFPGYEILEELGRGGMASSTRHDRRASTASWR